MIPELVAGGEPFVDWTCFAGSSNWTEWRMALVTDFLDWETGRSGDGAGLRVGAVLDLSRCGREAIGIVGWE